MLKPRLALSVAAIAALVAFLAACSSMRTVAPGASRADVRAVMGTPTSLATHANGERWIYSEVPDSYSVQFVDFDREGRVLGRMQALTAERVAQVVAGLTRLQVEALIGPSFYTARSLMNPDEIRHVYSYMKGATPTCFYIEYGGNAVVARTGSRPEDPRDRQGSALRRC